MKFMGRNFSFETYSASLTNEMRQSYFVRGKRYKVSKKKENWSENIQSLPAHVVLHCHPTLKNTIIFTGDFD